jgi:phosphatidylglycerophosphate synthase
MNQPHTPLPAEARRPIATREAGWAKRAAATLAASSATPNQISTCSAVFAAFGAAALAFGHFHGAFVLAALMVQMRLVCNLLDGMVAVEGGKSSPVGALYNEFPDRVSDTLLLAAAGYSCGRLDLGLFAALLACGTAYVRAYGGAQGLAQRFQGPMAKQHRMALLTFALLGSEAAAALGYASAQQAAMAATLWIIAIGAAATCWVRSRDIAAELNQRASRAP